MSLGKLVSAQVSRCPIESLKRVYFVYVYIYIFIYLFRGI